MKTTIIVPNKENISREDVLDWTDDEVPVMFLRLLGIHEKSFEEFEKCFHTFSSITSLTVDPTGLGASGEKMTNIMARMCHDKEYSPLIEEVSDQIISEIRPGERRMICVIGKESISYALSFYIFTCEKKHFNRDITLAFRHREGVLMGVRFAPKVLSILNLVSNGRVKIQSM